MADNHLFCDLCHEYVTHEQRFIHKRSKNHKNRVTQQENYEKKVIITERIPECISDKFLQFMEECFGKIKSHFCYGSKKMIVTFEAINSAEKCLSTEIVFNGKTIRARKPYNFYQAEAANTVPPEIVTPSINNDFQGKFEDQLHQLLTQTQLSPDYPKRLDALVKYLQLQLNHILPGCNVVPFGSMTTGLASYDSDVDLFVYLNYPNIEHLTKNRSENEFHKYIIMYVKRCIFIHKNGFTDVVGIANASVPIVKFTHSLSGLKCDLSFRGGFGVYNSYFLRELIATDSRIKPMLMFIKHWAKTHEIIEVGFFSCYAIVMLFIYYLQIIKPPLVPTVERLQRGKPDILIETWNCGFNETLLKSFKTENCDTILTLLEGFFRMCFEFDFEEYVITPYTGEMYSWNYFQNVYDIPEVFQNYISRLKSSQDKFPVWNCICIRDPFVHSRNITASISSTKLAYFREHCKLSAQLINDAKETEEGLLKKLLSQYIPPPPKEFNRHKKAAPVKININQAQLQSDGNYIGKIKSNIEEVLNKSFRCDYELVNNSCNDQDNESEHTFTYDCTMFYNTWERRKFYGSKNKNKDRMTREKIVTDALIRNVYGNIKPKEALFICHLTFKVCSDYIEFINECTEFNSLYDGAYHYINEKIRSFLSI